MTRMLTDTMCVYLCMYMCACVKRELPKDVIPQPESVRLDLEADLSPPS